MENVTYLIRYSLEKNLGNWQGVGFLREKIIENNQIKMTN